MLHHHPLASAVSLASSCYIINSSANPWTTLQRRWQATGACTSERGLAETRPVPVDSMLTGWGLLQYTMQLRWHSRVTSRCSASAGWVVDKRAAVQVYSTQPFGRVWTTLIHPPEELTTNSSHLTRLLIIKYNWLNFANFGISLFFFLIKSKIEVASR